MDPVGTAQLGHLSCIAPAGDSLDDLTEEAHDRGARDVARAHNHVRLY